MSGFKLDQQAGPKPDAQDCTVLNSWFCMERYQTVYVYREADGKSRAFVSHETSHRVGHWLNNWIVAGQHVWSVATEERAMEKLKGLVSEQAWRTYFLVGTFAETSKRSGITYFFRKGRPTIAAKVTAGGHNSSASAVDPAAGLRVMAVLCMHPLGYYEQSWAGVMCPTDDVIAHLLLMRGDEAQYWRKANHHQVWMASAGV